MKTSKLIGEWMRYARKAKNAHGIHSPFVFELYNKCLKGRLPAEEIKIFKEARRELLNDSSLIDHHDLGAGSRVLKNKGAKRTRHIAKTSLKGLKEAAMLALLAEFSKAQTVVELGTSLGTTTMLMALHNPRAKIYTIEGSPAIAHKAKALFDKTGLKNIEAVEGSFEEKLPQVLRQTGAVDLFLFDGNHRYEATMRYFAEAREYSREQSIFVFDDIRWSEEMLQAWKEIENHPKTSLTLDLFSMGIAFINPAFSRQNMVLKW